MISIMLPYLAYRLLFINTPGIMLSQITVLCPLVDFLAESSMQHCIEFYINSREMLFHPEQSTSLQVTDSGRAERYELEGQ